jgi:ABC-type sulfate transport system permease component
LKKYIVATALVVVFLVFFIPLASTNPDGLEKVVQTYGAQEQESIWNGLLSDYSFGSISNGYISTLLAGIFGVTTVLVSSLLISKVMFRKPDKIHKENKK